MSYQRSCISPEMLIEAGYVSFTDHTKSATLKEAYAGSYQKSFYDQRGRKYNIDFHFSRFLYSGGMSLERTAPFAHFRRGDTTFIVEMLHHAETLEEVEAFFEELWTKMSLDYYETDDGDRKQR